MIAKILISQSLKVRVGETDKILSEAHLSYSHPDLLFFSSDSKLGIAETRKIKDHLAFKPLHGEIKAVVLEDAANLTVEAQNALLKTLEELPQDALFILGADSDSKLLPTVTSRCEIVILNSFQNQAEEEMLNQAMPAGRQVQHDIEKLLKSSIEGRFEYIEKLKDREEFLHEMLSFFHQRLLEPATHERGRLTRLNAEFLQELLQAEEWAAQNVNIRAILEYLMLKMPKSKL